MRRNIMIISILEIYSLINMLTPSTATDAVFDSLEWLALPEPNNHFLQLQALATDDAREDFLREQSYADLEAFHDNMLRLFDGCIASPTKLLDALTYVHAPFYAFIQQIQNNVWSLNLHVINQISIKNLWQTLLEQWHDDADARKYAITFAQCNQHYISQIYAIKNAIFSAHRQMITEIKRIFAATVNSDDAQTLLRNKQHLVLQWLIGSDKILGSRQYEMFKLYLATCKTTDDFLDNNGSDEEQTYYGVSILELAFKQKYFKFAQLFLLAYKQNVPEALSGTLASKLYDILHQACARNDEPIVQLILSTYPPAALAQALAAEARRFGKNYSRWASHGAFNIACEKNYVKLVKLISQYYTPAGLSEALASVGWVASGRRESHASLYNALHYPLKGESNELLLLLFSFIDTPQTLANAFLPSSKSHASELFFNVFYRGHIQNLHILISIYFSFYSPVVINEILAEKAGPVNSDGCLLYACEEGHEETVALLLRLYSTEDFVHRLTILEGANTFYAPLYGVLAAAYKGNNPKVIALILDAFKAHAPDNLLIAMRTILEHLEFSESKKLLFLSTTLRDNISTASNTALNGSNNYNELSKMLRVYFAIAAEKSETDILTLLNQPVAAEHDVPRRSVSKVKMLHAWFSRRTSTPDGTVVAITLQPRNKPQLQN